MKSHSLTVHKIKEIYYCDQCDEGFEYQKALFEHHESVHVEDEESETSDSDSDASIKSIESIEIKEEIDEKAIIDISIDVKEEDVLAPAFLDISKFQEIVKFDDEAPKEISKPLKIQDPEDSDDHWADEGNWGDDWNITEEPELKPKFKPKTKPKKLILRVSVEKLNIEPYMKQPDLIFKESANDKIIYPFKCLEKDCKARLKTKKLLEAHAEVHKVDIFQLKIVKFNCLKHI